MLRLDRVGVSTYADSACVRTIVGTPHVLGDVCPFLGRLLVVRWVDFESVI